MVNNSSKHKNYCTVSASIKKRKVSISLGCDIKRFPDVIGIFLTGDGELRLVKLASLRGVGAIVGKPFEYKKNRLNNK